MRIGDIARVADVSTRTIRHYHRIGLLEEPSRESNGYRSYALDDVVLLLRIRRLVELGMSLDEIGDVLDDDERRRDVEEVIAELDADLARQEESIRERRRRLAELRFTAERAPVSERVGAIAEKIVEAYVADGPAARMELAVMEVLTTAMPGAIGAYEAALDDPSMVALSGDIAEGFDALRGVDPNDAAVEVLADRIVAAARGVHFPDLPVPDSQRIGVHDVAAWFDSADWMSEAQRRCLSLMMQRMAEGRE